MLKTNEDKLVEILVQCKPGPPRIRAGWRVSHEGKPFILPSIGGITLNCRFFPALEMKPGSYPGMQKEKRELLPATMADQNM